MSVRRLPFLISATLILTVFADWLFYDRPVGLNLALFLGIAALFAFLKGGVYSRRMPVFLSGILMMSLLVALLHQPGPLVLLMSLGALAGFAMMIRNGVPEDAVALAGNLFKFGFLSCFRGLIDFRRFSRLLQRNSFLTVIRKLGKGVHKWILPVGGSMFFLGLFSFANPILAREINSLSASFENFLLNWHLEPGRWFFWVAVGSAAWALLRVRIRSRRRSNPVPPLPMSNQHTSLLFRCLILFNGVFAIQTLMDTLYLLGGFHLPQGMTYAEYAHRGSYPLVITALLAAAFVLIAYRPGPASRETKVIRALVLVWLAQNVFLTFTAAWRLHLYTEVYNLTRLRVAAGIWMLLVASGLAWIALRIMAGHCNRWLVNRTIFTTFVVLYMCCFVNFDSRIAWHNVIQSREGGNGNLSLDYDYMLQLGPEALPALRWLQERGRYDRNRDVLSRLQNQLDANMLDWRGWSIRSWALWMKSEEAQNVHRARTKMIEDHKEPLNLEKWYEHSSGVVYASATNGNCCIMPVLPRAAE